MATTEMIGKQAKSPPTLEGNSLIPAEAVARISEIQNVHRDLASVMAASGDHFLRGVALAKAAVKLRELMSPNVMATLHELANSPFGYKIDQPAKYNEDQIRDLLIQGMLAGLRPTGNEINLLGGNLYCTKEAYQRRLKEKGVQYEPLIGQMEIDAKAGTCSVQAAIRYSYRGDSGALVFESDSAGHDYRIVIRSFPTDGPDLRTGKVTSKLLRRLYIHLFGQALQAAFADDAEDDALDGQARVVDAKEAGKVRQLFDASGKPANA